MSILKTYLPVAFHLLFWLFIFSAVNVDWSANWLDASIRPRTPAPLLVLILPIYFYGNALWLIPKYFSFDKWTRYLLYAALLFFVPELLRLIAYKMQFQDRAWSNLLLSRDSFIFGAPSPFFWSLNASLFYRFIVDRLFSKTPAENTSNSAESKQQAKLENKDHSATPPAYEQQKLLSEAEASALQTAVEKQLVEQRLFLKDDLSLRELAESVDSSEKKVSYLINQHMNSNFYELLNTHRIALFKEEIAKPENKNLSIVGVALNCGFSSKSSFYRAFKAQMGCSPSEYLKKQ